jgi:hypothetical protein
MEISVKNINTGKKILINRNNFNTLKYPGKIFVSNDIDEYEEYHDFFEEAYKFAIRNRK